MTGGDTDHYTIEDFLNFEMILLNSNVFENNFIFHFSVSRGKILGDRDVLVQYGSDINLTCRAEESPEPPKRVIW